MIPSGTLEPHGPLQYRLEPHGPLQYRLKPHGTLLLVLPCVPAMELSAKHACSMTTLLPKWPQAWVCSLLLVPPSLHCCNLVSSPECLSRTRFGERGQPWVNCNVFLIYQCAVQQNTYQVDKWLMLYDACQNRGTHKGHHLQDVPQCCYCILHTESCCFP